VEQITLRAYAKVNLTLDVVGRREDGYHLLESVMQSISLADTLTLKKGSGGISLHCDHPLVPTDQNNICWRAAAAFGEYTQMRDVSVGIRITKAIPVAAGLGGGSADAAAVLYGLNRLYAAGLDLGQLQEIGLTIGADVPFCLQGGTCLVQGIGEKVTTVPTFPQAALVLVKPQAAVSTAEAYGRLGEEAHGGRSTQSLVKLLNENHPIPSLAEVLENALESATIPIVPAVGVWKERLISFGAHGAMMSGSGPAVFGLFSHVQRAKGFRDRYGDVAEVFVAALMNNGLSVLSEGDRQ
jgi:4-diphosphocytidyl-2-C-methyl-D-erythritol kinase